MPRGFNNNPAHMAVGVPVKEEKSPQEVRAFVLSQLEQLPLEVKKIKSPSKWEVIYSARP